MRGDYPHVWEWFARPGGSGGVAPGGTHDDARERLARLGKVAAGGRPTLLPKVEPFEPEVDDDPPVFDVERMSSGWPFALPKVARRDLP